MFARTSNTARAFTLVELLVVIGIVVLLLSIFIPYLGSLRESDRRVRCADNLARIRDGLQIYARDNDKNLPRVIYDEVSKPNSYTCYTGADAADPFDPAGGVQPNDVTASLWLLVRKSLVKRSKFICPSTSHYKDPLFDAQGRPVSSRRRGNFRQPQYLSYSYASPFGSAEYYRLNSDWMDPELAVVADKNPGTGGHGDNVAGPAHDAQPLALSAANSNNHDKAGQNVLYADGHVAFQRTPYCGLKGDNIYTALSAQPLHPGEQPPANGNGVIGPNIGPAWNADSYLVPTDDEGPR